MTTNLKQIFEIQENLFHRHCYQFDGGVVAYAFEISTKLRLLLHQTNKSHSLLNQMFKDNKLNFPNECPFFSTCAPYTTSEIKNSPGVRCSIISRIFGLKPDSDEIIVAHTQAPLNNHKGYMWISFEEWWDKHTVLAFNGSSFSRKRIVNIVCNKLGGAHIDPEIPKNIQKLLDPLHIPLQFNIKSESGKKNTVITKTDELLYAIVRQIAYEFTVTSHEVIKPYLKSGVISDDILKKMKVTQKKMNV